MGLKRTPVRNPCDMLTAAPCGHCCQIANGLHAAQMTTSGRSFSGDASRCLRRALHAWRSATIWSGLILEAAQGWAPTLTAAQFSSFW